jgi:Phosphoglycerate dehydrogenase and related dehydrogenases
MKVLVPASGLDNTKQIQKKIAGKYGVDLVFEDETFDPESIGVLLVNHLNMHNLGAYLKKFPKVTAIQTMSAGVDKIRFEEIPDNVYVFSNAGAYSVPVAEHAVAMGITLAKNLMEYDRELKKGVFNQRGGALKLQGANALIVGYGGIGKHIGKLCTSMGMNVTGVGRSAGADGDEPQATLKDLDRLLPESDIVFISIPLNSESKDLFDNNKLNLMKENAVLVNVGRAPIIVQQALYDHLVKHTQFKVGIDTWWKEPGENGRFVQDYPISSLQNVLGSPHNSGMVEGIYEDALNHALENISRYQCGEKPQNAVRSEDYLSK